MKSKMGRLTRRQRNGALGFGALVAVGLAVTTATAMPPAQVPSDVAARPAQVQAGTCDSPGDLMFDLRALVVPPDSRGAAEFVGAQGASVVEGSDTSIQPATLDDLIGGPHLIAVLESDTSDTVIACGEIGGYLVPNDDDLVVGLREQGGSGFAGVALLDGDDDDNEVDVDIYLARDVTAISSAIRHDT